MECKNVSFSYEAGIDILKDITFKTKKGESVAIIGGNGVGKSTLLRILVGLELTYTGEVTVNERVVSKKNLVPIRNMIGYLFQDSDNQLFTQSVYDDIAFGLRNNGVSDNIVEERVTEVLEELSIGHLRDKKIYKMSGGEKKMASIATILVTKPDILLLDEPTAALDPKNRRILIQTLNRLLPTKIIATHDLDMVLDTCSRVILFSGGSIVADGPTDIVLKDKKLLDENGLELPLSLSGC